jgi:hypothetical protein
VDVLEDMKFLLFYATRLFPPTPQEWDGAQLKTELYALRKKFAEERAAAVALLNTAMQSHYADKEPPLVTDLCNGVASLFKSVDDLRKLASDAALHFPAEFRSAKPGKVRASFLAAKAEMEA